MKHCPTCTCKNCQVPAQEKQILWQRGRDSADTYPGEFKPASKHISHVTREPNTASKGINYIDSFYLDFVDDDEQTLDYALEKTKAKKARSNPAQVTSATEKRSPNPKSRENSASEINSKSKTSPNTKLVSSTQPNLHYSGLSNEQKHQIIKFCKKDWSGNAIGGLVLADGTITLEKNQAADPTQFWFNWYGKDAVGVWHRHIKGMPQKLEKDDINAAKKAGLSMYMIYDPGGNIREDSYIWDEYHPGGEVNKTPVRHYRICFVCPTDEQLKEEIERANRYIKEDNENYQKEVEASQKRIEKKYNQTQAKLTAATLTLSSAQDRVNVLTDKYRLAASNCQEVTPFFSKMKQHN